MKKENIVKVIIIVAVVAITGGVIGFMFAKNAQAPIQQPASALSTQSEKGIVSENVMQNEKIKTETIIQKRDTYKNNLPKIDCATWFVRNDVLTRMHPFMNGKYDIYEMPSCLVIIDTQNERYTIFAYRDALSQSSYYRKVNAGNQTNLGYNITLNENGVLIMKIWKLEADCSKWQNNLRCANDSVNYKQPLSWTANDEEWLRIGSVVETISIDNFEPISTVALPCPTSFEKTSEWQVYMEKGISFKYPPYWNVRPVPDSDGTGDRLSVSPKTGEPYNGGLGFFVTIYEWDMPASKTGIRDDAKTWYQKNIPGGRVTDGSILEINGASAFSIKDNYNVYILSNKKGRVVYSSFAEKDSSVFSIPYRKDETEYSYTEYLPVYEAFINSIVFLESGN